MSDHDDTDSVECEELASHPSIVADSMTFVLLLLVINLLYCMYTNDNIKIITCHD